MGKTIQLSLLIFLMFNYTHAQITSTFDKIIKKDYDILEVNIKKVSDSHIEFMYPDEDILNTVDTQLIHKIILKNGRIQEFENNRNLDSKEQRLLNAKRQPIKKNTIAVLPIPHFNSNTSNISEGLSQEAQNYLYKEIIERASNITPLAVQDIRTTNNLLKKAGIDYNNIEEIAIEDLQSILGVDNVLAVKITCTENILYSDITRKAYGYLYTERVQTGISVDHEVYFDVYKHSNKIYSKVRTPFLKLSTSWKDSVIYLLKRSPIYN
ncbi:hypothetical protein D1631_03070 [Chryseobacterium nematophagum]|uniref:Uncharacterized protein n=1 Tax=Chryseobacterium nematophagum TaxID=2305228 RepID=A0A3M7TD69_9FLAO|nr:hypothetical protein [Chryseobacterium nematophagum]RNA60984.1 hypothetical protein D1631_03070 [Chryseobacterium nematophagum]